MANGSRPPDIQSLLAQPDATRVGQPGVVPDDNDSGGLFQTILDFLGRPAKAAEAMGALGGPGALAHIEPGGGSLMASLPLLGRQASSAVRNVADDPRFLQRWLGDVPAETLYRTFETAGTTQGIEAGATRADQFRRLAEVLKGEKRANALGVAEALQTRSGRAGIDALGLSKKLSPQEAIRRADQSAIQTLLEQVGGR